MSKIHVLTAQIKIYAPYCHSLKEKRKIVQSIIKRVRNKFNVSIAEVDVQDVHQTIVLGIACVSGSKSFGDDAICEVIRFIEGNIDAEVVDINREER